MVRVPEAKTHSGGKTGPWRRARERERRGERGSSVRAVNVRSTAKVGATDLQGLGALQRQGDSETEEALWLAWTHVRRDRADMPKK